MTLTAAIIGCGRMGAAPSSRIEGQVPCGWLPISHAEALTSLDNLTLSALCDSNEAVLEQYGALYNVPALYTDYRQLIDEIKPDLLTIATRTPIKAEIIEYACQHGVKGLYVEKPLANSIERCHSLLALVEQHKVKLAYGVNRRYHDVYRHAHELIQQGLIGDTLEIIVEHGKSQLLWTHPHSVDLILFFANSTNLVATQAYLAPESILQLSKSVIDSDPVIEHAFFKFDNGINATITKTNGLNVRITGTEGNLSIHGNGASIQVHQKAEPSSPYYTKEKSIFTAVKQSATLNVISELSMAILKNTAPPISLKEIDIGMQMLIGCVWSHLNNSQLVLPDETPQDLLITGRYAELYA